MGRKALMAVFKAIHEGNLANVEVLLFACRFSGIPNTCPFGRWQTAMNSCVYATQITPMMCVFSSRRRMGGEATLWVCL